MARLNNKRIVLGITGGIAAYKSATLLRLLRQEGADVQVICTEQASSFIGIKTLAALSGKGVLLEFSDAETGAWNNHVALGSESDLLLIAPLTAQSMAKMAQGFCDNLLSAVYLSARCPVMIAPAMDLDMYAHPAVQRNVQHLRSDGCQLIGPEYGALASGMTGLGRMSEPEAILEAVCAHFNQASKHLKGRHVMISAGPTYEAIDPVRFISNHSSGKMGYALAEVCASLGAAVTLISGPVHLPCPAGVQRIMVKSAAEMHEACMSHRATQDFLFMAAAVADFTPAQPADGKIKKHQAPDHLILKPTRDILADLGAEKSPGQTLIGFALETEEGTEQALDKLKRKNCDFLVLNSLQHQGAGFGGDTNQVSIFAKDGSRKELPLASKTEIAQSIVEWICLNS
ncbi:MAG: bifunctional phosphopantothenoylcysteine decarboxylase/phosphopantothenate--cysteine ligase CoaBC [Bacteroidota bacterium]|jgi:phosphopantothenoylcysteine decarboxylase/phosphopantothenate--cysteine ligase